MPHELTPISAVTSADPYPYYAELVAERPFGRDEALGLWAAASAEAVTAVLRTPQLRVRPPAEPVPAGIVGTPAGDVFGRLVRMTDGPVQVRLKQAVGTALGTADPHHVREIAAARTAKVLEGWGSAPLQDLMFAIPAQVTAVLSGLDDAAADEASALIGDFVQCIPANATPDQQAAAAVAAAKLQELLGPRLDERGDGLLGELVRAATGEDRAALLANGIGLLSQTYDATAGLIGNTLIALSRSGGASRTADGLTAFVREVARHDAPIQNTRRFAAEPFALAGQTVEAGQAILVVLAAANRDPAVNPDPDEFRADRPDPAIYTFGAAAHGCPGETVAVAIASGVVGALVQHGFDPATLPSPVAYRPLANARIPVL